MKSKEPLRMDVSQEELDEILAISKGFLSEHHFKVIDTLVWEAVWVKLQVAENKITISKLRQLFFGKKTETLKKMKKRAKKALAKLLDKAKKAKNALNKAEEELKKAQEESAANPEEPIKPSDKPEDPSSGAKTEPSNIEKSSPSGEEGSPLPLEPKKKLKGHGKHAADEYDFEKIILHSYPNLAPGDDCPLCPKGRVYSIPPEVIITFKGKSLLTAEANCAEGLRCSACQAVFRAKFPKEIITQPRPDYEARAQVCLAKYMAGTPLYRLEFWQRVLHVPISDTELWEWSESVALAVLPVHKALLAYGANGTRFHVDDTPGKILDLMAENALVEAQEEKNTALGIKNKPFRRGMFTSVVLSLVDGFQIVFYFTGRKNSGENFDDVLDLRTDGLTIPVQSCDASTSNNPERHKTKISYCFNHARHNFCELVENWPSQTITIISLIDDLFNNDRNTKKMEPEERLAYHQKHSTTVVDKLYEYSNSLLINKIVEPASSFAKAINYLNNHKEGLCLFLNEGQASLSNNAAERCVKPFALIRKNSLFYKSLWGAYVGDILIGIIRTCILNNVNPYNYLVAIQANGDKAANNPKDWLPWNYTKNKSCPYVQRQAFPIVEIYQEDGPNIVFSPQVDLEAQKKSLRANAREYFHQSRSREECFK